MSHAGSAGVMGWPIGHSRSPVIHRFWLEALGLDGDYSRFAVPPERLGQALAALHSLGLSGVNVTVPHKAAVIPHLDTVEDGARAIGAVNCILARGGELHGLNTDIVGFLEPLAPFDLDGAHAVVIGAGGAARAVLAGLGMRGIAEVTMLNRSEPRAASLLGEMGLSGTVHALGTPLPPADLVVNASLLGMVGQPPLEADLAPLPDHAIVYDIVTTPAETELLADARQRGLGTIDGLAMLIGQAAPAFAHFYGHEAPRGRDADLRARLLG